MSASNEPFSLPKVSVVVPVFNDRDRIGELIECLLEQDYPPTLLELIIVDNNSTDDTKEVIRKYSVTLLEENDVQSSYAARNMGIRHASGQVIAFIDSDCRPEPTWIRKGVEAITARAGDLAGGNVRFVLSQKATAAEMYDSITHIQVEQSIAEHQAAPTANLFVRREVFERIGLFPATVRSGGDFTWTKEATRNGNVIVFASEATVTHPARPFIALLEKRYRTGGGAIAYWRSTQTSRLKIIYMVLRQCLPRRLANIRKAIRRNGTNAMNKKLLRIWGVSYACSLATVLGILASLSGRGRRAASANCL